MAKPNKFQRIRNRRNADREDLTKIYASEADERVGLAGYEDCYEISRFGEVFSKRLKRFIKHKFNDLGGTYSTYIEFQLEGEKVQMGIGKAVAMSWLTEEQRQDVAERLPAEIDSIERLKGQDLTNTLAKEYNLGNAAIFYVFKEEINRRRAIRA